MSRHDAQEEAEQVKAKWRRKLTKVDEIWYIIDSKWFRSWCHFTGFDPIALEKEQENKSSSSTASPLADGVEEMKLDETPAPGQIDNTQILEGFIIIIIIIIILILKLNVYLELFFIILCVS